MAASPAVPNSSSPSFEAFLAALKSQPVSPAPGLSALNQPMHHQLQKVHTVQTGFTADQCWFNCLRFCLSSSNSRPIFGWALWDIGCATFVAQHHAVVETTSGLVDVTLAASFPEILFMPDNNAPFDFKNFKFPLSFEHSPSGSVWYTGFGEETPNFNFAKLPKPQPDILELVSSAKAQGVI